MALRIGREYRDDSTDPKRIDTGIIFSVKHGVWREGFATDLPPPTNGWMRQVEEAPAKVDYESEQCSSK